LQQNPQEADSSIDWAAGFEEIRQSHDRQHIDGGHTIALKAEGRGAGDSEVAFDFILSARRSRPLEGLAAFLT
jgi:hypothetical protein